MLNKFKFINKIFAIMLGACLTLSLLLPLCRVEEWGAMTHDFTGMQFMFESPSYMESTRWIGDIFTFLMSFLFWHQFILGLIIIGLATFLLVKENAVVDKILSILLWIGFYFCICYGVIGIIFAEARGYSSEIEVTTYSYISFIVYAFVIMFRLLFKYVEKFLKNLNNV